MELLYGINAVTDVLKIKSRKIHKVYATRNTLKKLPHFNAPLEVVHPRDLDEMVGNTNHQGIAVQCDNYQYANLDFINAKSKEGNSKIVFLDHIEDPHNLGAIIRSAEAFGFDAIIINKDRSADVNSTVVKTSVGTSENMPIVKVTNSVQTLKKLKKLGYWVIGGDLEATAGINDDIYEGNIVIVVGNEGKGIARLTKEECDYLVKIPMYGKTNSLNVSVATGILLHSAVSSKK